MSKTILHIAAGIAIGFAVSALAEASPGSLLKCKHASDGQEICAVSDQTLDKLMAVHESSTEPKVETIHLPRAAPLALGEIVKSATIVCKEASGFKICGETDEEVDAAFSCLAGGCNSD